MRTKALFIRIIRQFFRDKRTMALMFIAPMFVLWLMSLVFNGEEYVPSIAVVDLPEPLVEILEEQGATVKQHSLKEARELLENTEMDAYMYRNGDLPQVVLEGGDPTANKAVILAVQDAMQKWNPGNTVSKPDVKYLHGSEDMALFDNLGPVLIGLFIFFFVFLLAGVSFLRERTSGTLERLLSTPIRRWEIVAGYISGFGLFAVLQAALIAYFSIEILDMRMVGSIWYVMLIAFLLALTALTLGTLLSAYANNEFQMFQFIPLVIVPQVFFSGLFNLDTMSDWLQRFSDVMPLTYGAEALRNIMIRGKGWEEIAFDVYVLLGFSFVFMLLNVLALRKHRKV